MFENKFESLATRSTFLRRLATSTSIGLLAAAVSLFAGMLGYHGIEGLSWVDAFLNAAMLLGGMGPLEHERNTAGKVFEGIYAIYCGLAVISVAGIIAPPSFIGSCTSFTSRSAAPRLPVRVILAPRPDRSFNADLKRIRVKAAGVVGPTDHW